jgi:hypothetical protein
MIVQPKKAINDSLIKQYFSLGNAPKSVFKVMFSDRSEVS